MNTCAALAFIIPDRHRQNIDDIRSTHDKAFDRWMPHINFLFPFLPEDKLKDTASRLAKELNTVPSFVLNLNEIGSFPQGAENTYHLKPKDESQMVALYNAVRKALPEFKPKRNDFHPHLTLGQWEKSEDPTITLKGKIGTIEVLVDKLCIITRTKEGPFTVYAEIPLGSFAESGFEE